MSAIARLGTYAIDCPDPHALAAFYQRIVDWPILPQSDHDWVELSGPNGINLAFQQAADYQPPTWPGGERPQQAHLDFYVDDLDAGESAVLAVGARKHDVQPGTSFRVYLDPAGHPFCLCQS